jgi:TonB family protein
MDGRSLQWPPFMKRVAIVLLLLAACSTAPPAPAPVPVPAPVPEAPQPKSETAIGSGHVNASLLNVRSEPSMQGDVVGHARRGERVTILGESGTWLRVRTGGGEVGWVSSQHVARDDASSSSPAPSRGHRGCPPDSDYRFLTPPRPSFDENGPHGVVTIEASVNAQGNVTSTKVVSNTTGQEALATVAAREVTAAKFAPPVRNCVARAFLFTYRRAF